MTVHRFADSAKRGAQGVAGLCRVLDALGVPWRLATQQEEWEGWDVLAAGRRVEVKTDSVAHRTGNVFVETLSNKAAGRPGWTVSSQADWLVYVVERPRSSAAYVVPMRQLKRAATGWRHFPAREVRNERGNVTVGHLVPLDELRRLAAVVVALPVGAT